MIDGRTPGYSPRLPHRSRTSARPRTRSLGGFTSLSVRLGNRGDKSEEDH